MPMDERLLGRVGVTLSEIAALRFMTSKNVPEYPGDNMRARLVLETLARLLDASGIKPGNVRNQTPAQYFAARDAQMLLAEILR